MDTRRRGAIPILPRRDSRCCLGLLVRSTCAGLLGPCNPPSLAQFPCEFTSSLTAKAARTRKGPVASHTTSMARIAGDAIAPPPSPAGTSGRVVGRSLGTFGGGSPDWAGSISSRHWQGSGSMLLLKNDLGGVRTTRQGCCVWTESVSDEKNGACGESGAIIHTNHNRQ